METCSFLIAIQVNDEQKAARIHKLDERLNFANWNVWWRLSEGSIDPQVLPPPGERAPHIIIDFEEKITHHAVGPK